MRSNQISGIVGGCSILILSAACAEAPVGPAARVPAAASMGASPITDLTGVWQFHEEATLVLFDFDGHGAKAFRCSSDGAYTFTQTGTTLGGTFDQTGTCVAEDGTSLPNDFTDVGVSGTVTGRSVTFDTADGCRYTAALSGSDASELRGAGRCGGGQSFGTYRTSFVAAR